jgi:pyruvate carboxylase subunit B
VEEPGGSPVISYVQQMPAQPPVAAPAPAAPAAAPKPAAPPKAEPPAPPKPAAPAPPAKEAADVDGTPMKAPMPGMIIRYEKKVGDAVSTGDAVVILEAMKMENALQSPADGTIQAINFSEGDSVAKDAVLCVIG